MNVGKAIYNILSNDAPVAALLTESGKVKVFPVLMPERYSYPVAVYSVVSNTPHGTKTGVSRFDQVRVQIDCYGRVYEDTGELAQAVRAALDRKAPGTYGGITVKGISYVSTNMALEEDDNVFRISEDYQIIIDVFA